MEYNLSKTFARIGGALILCGLVLPWYKLDLGALGDALGATGGSFQIGELKSGSISAWDGDKTIFFIVGTFGVFALSQVPFASAGIVGRFFMFAGFAGFILLGYKIIHPPLDILEILKMKLKPQPGIYLALVGMAFTAYAGWEQVKRDLAAPKHQQAIGSDWHTTVATNSVNQGYAQPQMMQQPARQPAPPQPAAAPGAPMQAPAQAVAATQQAAPRVVPPDPFAPKAPPAG